MVDRGRLGERAQATGATRTGMASGLRCGIGNDIVGIKVLRTQQTATHPEAAVEALGALINARTL